MTYYRRNLIILSATIFLAAVSWNQIVPFLPLFLKELGVPPEDLLKWTGLLFSAQSLAGIVATPFWGKMGDKYGRKPMILRAGIFLSALYFAISLCKSPTQLLVLRFLNGALTGFIPGSMALVSTNTPPPLAPKYLATTQTFSAAGQIIGPALGGILASIAGYRGSMQLSGVLVLLCTIAVVIAVKEPNKPKDVESTSLLADFKFSAGHRSVASLMVAGFLSGVFINSVVPFISIHMKNLMPNIKDWQSGSIFAFPALALMLFAQVWRKIGSVKGYYRMILLSMIGIILSAFAFSMTKSAFSFCAVFFASGVFLAGVSVSAAAATCEDVDASFRGRAFGMQISSTGMGAFIAPTVVGWLGSKFGVTSGIGLTGLMISPLILLYYSIALRKKKAAQVEEPAEA